MSGIDYSGMSWSHKSIIVACLGVCNRSLKDCILSLKSITVDMYKESTSDHCRIVLTSEIDYSGYVLESTIDHCRVVLTPEIDYSRRILESTIDHYRVVLTPGIDYNGRILKSEIEHILVFEPILTTLRYISHCFGDYLPFVSNSFCTVVRKVCLTVSRCPVTLCSVDELRSRHKTTIRAPTRYYSTLLDHVQP